MARIVFFFSAKPMTNHNQRNPGVVNQIKLAAGFGPGPFRITGRSGSRDVSIAEVSSLSDCGRFFTMLVNEGEVNGLRLLSQQSVQLLRRDWLNDFTREKRRRVTVLARVSLGCPK